MSIIDYGPLDLLIGEWFSDTGLDISPEPDGSAEESQYYETIIYEPAGNVINAEIETLAVLQYRQEVTRKSDNKIFHRELGFILWNVETKQVIQNFSIPRGLSLVAGGKVVQNNPITIQIHASVNSQDWQISQSPFLTNKAKTLDFSREITIKPNELQYKQTTKLDIYGQIFNHTDTNLLTRR